ncbi:MAG: hypothetical protein HOP10_09085 [Chitinophagaceae bacterium]|nr:hypothetical protein [Chitinophagaceae bacterium]
MLLALRFFALDDLLLGPLCLLILYAIIRNRAEKNNDPEVRRIYYRGFYFKIICVLAYTFVTEFVFKGGDTALYYQSVQDLRAALREDFDYLSTIINSVKLSKENPLTPFFTGDNYAYDYTYNYMLSSSNFFVPRLGLLPSYVFFNNYLCINFVFGFFALGGAIRIFKFFHYYYPDYKKEIALAAIFLPSVGFWSAGLLKDPVCFGSIGYILYAVQNIFVRKKNIKASVIWIIVCGFLLYFIKVYILLTLILAILIWQFAETNKLIADRTLRNIFSFLTLFISFLVAYFLLNYFTSQEAAKEYKLDTLLDKAEYQRRVIQDLASTAPLGSNFSINTSNPVALVPNSIAATFFRPFLWEVKSPVALFSAIESLLFLLFTLFFFFKRGVGKYFKLTFADPRMLMCFIFAMVFAVAVGASTSNFGALSRYKIPCMPFYFMGLLLVYKKAALHYPKWFYKILKWV